MKLLFLVALCLPLVACGSRVYYPNGRVCHADYTNFSGTTEVRNGKFYYKRQGTQDAATPTRESFDALGNLLIKAGVGATGARIP